MFTRQWNCIAVSFNHWTSMHPPFSLLVVCVSVCEREWYGAVVSWHLPLHREEGSGTASLFELFFSPEILGNTIKVLGFHYAGIVLATCLKFDMLVVFWCTGNVQISYVLPGSGWYSTGHNPTHQVSVTTRPYFLHFRMLCSTLHSLTDLSILPHTMMFTIYIIIILIHNNYYPHTIGITPYLELTTQSGAPIGMLLSEVTPAHLFFICMRAFYPWTYYLSIVANILVNVVTSQDSHKCHHPDCYLQMTWSHWWW